MITKHDIKLITIEEPPRPKYVPICTKCGINPRKLGKKNKYDSYCKECRSKTNKEYRDRYKNKI